MGDDPLPSPVDCIGSWGNWTECSETCGGGEKTREYSITNPVENGGVECSREDGDTENIPCNTQGCPVNCVGSWGDWSECSKKYGNGRKFKEYTITTPAANGGQACPHPDHHVETTTCKENNLSGSFFKKFGQKAKNKARWAIYTNKRNQADQRAGKNTPPKIFTNGIVIKPLNMAGQGRTVGTWRECRDRCINTPGCEYFNRFPNGGCHITDGKEGPKPGGGNPTSHSGKARAFSPNSSPRTDGIWYMPLDMEGQGRSTGSWQECRDRCINTGGCKYFNSFPNGGCHITDGIEGTKTVTGNPTANSGKALIE